MGEENKNPDYESIFKVMRMMEKLRSHMAESMQRIVLESDEMRKKEEIGSEITNSQPEKKEKHLGNTIFSEPYYQNKRVDCPHGGHRNYESCGSCEAELQAHLDRIAAMSD